MTSINEKLLQIKARADESVDDKADDFRLNQDCSCDPGSPYYDDTGTCWYHLSREEQGRYGFRAGFNSREDEVATLHECLRVAVEALEWAADEVCPHADAIKQLEEYPKMQRAFCTCSSWVYRGKTVNLAREAQAKILALLNEIGEK